MAGSNLTQFSFAFDSMTNADADAFSLKNKKQPLASGLKKIGGDGVKSPEKNRNHEMLLEFWVNEEPILRIASVKGNRYPKSEDGSLNSVDFQEDAISKIISIKTTEKGVSSSIGTCEKNEVE